jgi:hypothetical protein
MTDRNIRGSNLRGDAPTRLELSDGSRLMLDGTADIGQVSWRRLGRRRERVSVSEAENLAGEQFAGYVAVRTRAEAEWLRAVSDWCREQSDRLHGELAEARR